MSIPGLAARNLFRNKLRSFLTVSGVVVAVLAFVLLRTVIWAWTAQTEDTAVDRIVTRHKVTFVMELPMSHFDEIRSMKEVRCATFQNWFGGKDPNHDQEFFATIACDEKTLFEVYDDIVTPPDQRKAFLEDKQGALVGEKLMQRMGWKLGQTIMLQSQIYPGDWEFHIAGVYQATRKAVDPAQVFFHWDLLNERRPERIKNHIGWIVSRVGKGASAARTSLAIDAHFDALDVQTLSQDEHAFQQSFLAMFSAVLTALDTVSLVILGIMMLILG
ncbi:MAG: ABC transporter permease, partial [Planctomycetota bacterium]